MVGVMVGLGYGWVFLTILFRFPHETSKRTELRNAQNLETNGTSKMSSKLLGAVH